MLNFYCVQVPWKASVLGTVTNKREYPVPEKTWAYNINKNINIIININMTSSPSSSWHQCHDENI